MTVSVETPIVDQLAELQRQTDVLVEKGYPALAGLTEEAFRGLVAPLRVHLPEEPFVLVITDTLVPLARLIELTALKGKCGFTTMAAGDVARFQPTLDLAIPDIAVYLITAVDTGHETLNVRAGDKRVTGIWVSKGAPRLGWCWAGNPHTWLGMASTARRVS